MGGLELPCHLYFTSYFSAQLEKVKSLFQQCPISHRVRDETTEPLNKKSKNDDSIEHVSEASEVWLSYNGYRLTLVDKKTISDGSMLNDNHINLP